MSKPSQVEISRRSLLLTAAGASVMKAAEGGSAPGAGRPEAEGPRVAVVGAGALGGWTALHLRRAGARVTLLDAWGPGNSRSSSGGESRVIRAMYGSDRIYSEWVRRSFELWGELEASTGQRLYRQTGGLWMFRGDDGYARSSLPVLEELGFVVERPGLVEAARRWPQIDFSGVQSLYFEPRAGVLAARSACEAVCDRLVAEGGAYRLAAVEAPAVTEGKLAGLRLGDGTALEADAYVFCCGPWLGSLFPEVLGERMLASRQEVHYFGPPAGVSRYDLGQLPVWIDFGERIFYGLPRSAGRGMKIADDTRGERFDPTSGDRTPTAAAIERSRRFLGERFPALADAPLLEARVCQYENSPDGHLIVDRHPAAENCWLVGGGSGHGFKLAPALGEYVARVVVGGAELEPAFSLSRLGRIGESSTQFD